MQWPSREVCKRLKENSYERMHVLSSFLGRLDSFAIVSIREPYANAGSFQATLTHGNDHREDLY
jgi:hypothetical protein